ncbi:MAG: tetrathionate reductase subunit TtrA, partial [Gammaproteobacteria bacterium]|nr:tetrathionate reductase subunit TtrA [Gammaproteobacteria bacterium]
INETNAFADYIVPDAFFYEAWGMGTAWAVPTKLTTARWPVVEPAQAKLADGTPISMETFFIAVAKRLGLPGFGDNAIPDAGGQLHALNRAEDYHLRGAVNLAYAGKPVPDAADEDIELSGVARIAPALRAVLKDDEWRKAAFIYSRGGRFQARDETYTGERLSNRFKGVLQIYNETLGTARNTLTGQRHIGTATWIPPVFADGTPVAAVYPEAQWPFKLVSYKSVLQNSYSLGARRLTEIHPTNPVAVNEEDAARLGIRPGDAIRLTTPGGTAVGTALVCSGVRKGVLAIEHGFGHRELGARRHWIGGKQQSSVPGLRAGVNLNDLGFADPRRSGLSTLGDWVIGTAARQALPARIERVQA